MDHQTQIMIRNFIAGLIMAFILSGCSNKYYEGPKSDHFDGEKFFNPWNPQPPKTFSDMIKWRTSGGNVKWPEKVERKMHPKPVAKVDGEKIKVTNIGHATFLIQTEGLNIITDPVFSDRASPFSFIGPKRAIEPGLSFSELPKIDVILVSHNHYDHLDIASLKKLNERDKPVILTPLGNDSIIKAKIKDANVKVLDWADSTDTGGIKFTLEPAQHWSARWTNDKNKALWGAFVIETTKRKIYFAGDTGYGTHFKQTGNKYGGFDLALIPIGAYEPRWFMKYAHMNPEDSLNAFDDLKAKKALAMHFEVFKLTDEGYYEPREDILQRMKEERRDPQSFLVPEVGEEFEF